MASSSLLEASRRLLSQEFLRSVAKLSVGALPIPVRLRRAIKRYLRDRQKPHMRRSVLQLSESLNDLKGANLLVSEASGRRLLEDPSAPPDAHSARWKVRSAYGDLGLRYGDDQSVAYVASRMPAVFSACHRVLREVRRRLPEFSPTKVLDFGAGPGTAMWAVRQVWPRSLEEINIVEPSQDMQRAGQSLLKGWKRMPLIQSYESLQLLNKDIKKQGRKHDLVISSYALGEIPSISDRITVVRQLWDLTKDVLVLVEPGTPHGFKIISQMRSHILWMEKRKCRKLNTKTVGASDEILNTSDESNIKSGAFVIAPCPHDGRCPLENTTKYCHFVQRLERTSVQRAYKRSAGGSVRGFEDEKFCFVALRRGARPSQAWPLDGMKLPSLEELKRLNSGMKEQGHVIDQKDLVDLEADQPVSLEDSYVRFASDNSDSETDELVELQTGTEENSADLGGGWGRIVFPPIRRGKLVEVNVCRCTKRDCSEGVFERVVLTRKANPTLHLHARKSFWGDLWPCGTEVK